MEPPSSSRVESCLKSLEIETRVNWLDHGSCINKGEALDEALYLVRNISDSKLLLELVIAISQFANEHTPWSDQVLASKATSIEASIVEPLLPQIIEYIQPKLLFTSSKTTTGRNPRAARNKGLRPALGHSTSSSMLENMREAWKSSKDLLILGTACFWITFDSSSVSIGTFAALSLNVIDDSDPLFRAQGCYLINKLVELADIKVLQSLGFLKLLKEELQTCFNFLPRLTPGAVSLSLMKAAYPTLIKLIELELVSHGEANLLGGYMPYLEVLDKNVLGLISHIQGHAEGPSNLILEYLLNFASNLIDKKVGAAVLACWSRLNSMLCRLITDPLIVDSDNGPSVVASALAVQNTTLKIITERRDGSCDLIFDYRYDLLTSWTVYIQRLIKYGVGVDAKELAITNIKFLGEIAASSEINSKKLQLDFKAIVESYPEVGAYFM